MKKWLLYAPILLLCACMLTAILYCIDYQLRENLLSQVEFWDTANNFRLIPVYDEAEEKYDLFLPSCSSTKDIEVKTVCMGGGTAGLSSVEAVYETNLSEVPLNKDLALTVSFLFYREEAVIRIWQCGQIPTLHIETGADLLGYIHENQENRVDVRSTFYDSEGNVMLDGTAQMYGRGNTTWFMGDKKPYNLKFQDPISIGPFQQIQKLSLLAEYNDRSKMHNALVHHAGKEIGMPYGSEYMYVDLFVNGEYLGIYGVATKDNYLKSLEEDEIKAVFFITSGEEHTGFWPKLWRNPVQMVYGNQDETLQTITRVESALESRDWVNCEKWLDMDSLAQKYMLEEFFANSDVGYGSQYFYIDQNDVVHAMLPWDYDLSMGDTFFFHNNKLEYEAKVFLDYPNWYGVLLENADFRQKCLDILETEYSEAFLTELDSYLQTIGQEIEASWSCDRARWAPKYMAGTEFQEGFTARDYPEYLMSLLRSRKQFLEKLYKNWDGYCQVTFKAPGSWNASFCIPKGERLSEYLQDAIILERRTDTEIWRTEGGLTPEDIVVVNENITFRLDKTDTSQREGE